MDKKNIGKNVQLLRNAFGLSQAKLAEMLGVSTIHLSHIETGKVGMSMEILLAICDYLAVTPNDVLSGEYNKKNVNANPKAFFENSPYLTENDQALLLDITGLLAKKNQEKNRGQKEAADTGIEKEKAGEKAENKGRKRNSKA